MKVQSPHWMSMPRIYRTPTARFEGHPPVVAWLVNIDNEDRCILLGGQHDVLAPCERLRSQAVIAGPYPAVLGATAGHH